MGPNAKINNAAWLWNCLLQPQSQPRTILSLISLAQTFEESITAGLALPWFLHWDCGAFILANSTDSVPEAEEVQLQERLSISPPPAALTRLSLKSSHRGGKAKPFLTKNKNPPTCRTILLLSTQIKAWADKTDFSSADESSWFFSFYKAGKLRWRRKIWYLCPDTSEGKFLGPVQTS